MRLFKKINNELNSAAPDFSDKISEKINWQAIANEKPVKKQAKKATFRPAYFASFVAAALAILIIPLSIIITRNSAQPAPVYAAYDVIIDVNPNISLTVGEGDKITAQKGLNEDGVVFLHNRNYVGVNVSEATQTIITELKNKGVITAGSVVRLSAYDHGTRKIKDDVQTKIEKITESVLGGDVTLLFLSDDELDKIEEYYENNTLKEDEKTIVEEFKKKTLNIAAEKLTATRDLLTVLKKYPVGGKNVELTPADAEKLTAYAEKYRVDLDFNKTAPIPRDEFIEFIEDLEETAEDLQESIDELSAKQDDYSDLMEDLIDLIKDCLWD